MPLSNLSNFAPNPTLGLFVHFGSILPPFAGRLVTGGCGSCGKGLTGFEGFDEFAGFPIGSLVPVEQSDGVAAH